MSKKLLYSIIVVLIITNIASLLFWNKADDANNVIVDDVGDEQLVDHQDDEVASVAGEEITYSDWMRSLRENHGKNHLKEMINKAVVKKLTEQTNLSISEKVIDREIAFLTTMSGIMSKDEIDEQEAEWEMELRYRYELEALLTEDVHIPEEEVQAHYDKYYNQYDFSASFQLSHLTVNDRKTADKVIEELKQGASFHLLAKEYSLDEESRIDGGYLGYFTEGSQFIPYGYNEQIEKIEEHSYSEPFAVGNEVAIIYLHRYLPEIKFTYDELKTDIARELALKKIDRTSSVDQLWDKLDVDWVYED